MTPLARILVLIAGVAAVVGVVAIGFIAALVALTSDDPLDVFAIPLLAFAVVVVVATLLLMAVIAQGVKSLREGPEE